jgi:chromosome segregation ATPase
MLVDERLFANLAGEAARRLTDLFDKRRELRRQAHDAVAGSRTAHQELEAAEREEHRAAGRCTALGEHAQLKRAQAQLAKATRAAQQAAETETKLLQGIEAIEDEMVAVARAQYDELLAELQAADKVACQQAHDAIRTLDAVAATRRDHFRAAMALGNAVGHHERNRSLREPHSPERMIVNGVLPMFTDQPSTADAASHV